MLFWGGSRWHLNEKFELHESVSIVLLEKGCEGLPGVLLLNILDSTSSFDTSNRKSGSVSEAANNPGLPLQRTLECLVELRGVAEVDDIDIPICSSNDQEVLLHIQGIDSFLTLYSRNSCRLAQVPVLDRLVPRSSNNHRRRSSR